MLFARYNANFVKLLNQLQDIKPLFKNIILYCGSSVLVKSISFFIAPISMRLLSPSDYGLLALLNSFISIMCIMGGCGLRQALSLEYFHCSNQEKLEIIRKLLTIYACMVPILIGLICACKPILQTWWIGQPLPTHLFVLSILVIALYFVSELVYQLLQYEQQARTLTLLQVCTSLLAAAITISLLYGAQLGITSIIIGQLCTILIVCISAVVWCKRHRIWLWEKPSLRITKEYLYKGLPFVPSMLFAWILAAGDRWILAHYATLHDVGIYTVADTFGQLFQLTILVPFSNAYLPYLMHKFAQHPKNLMLIETWNRKMLILFVPILFIAISLGIAWTRPAISWLLPPIYHEALVYIWLLLTGYLLLVASYFPAALIQFQKKTTFLATALCIPAVLNVVLNRLLVPTYKIMGCVLATVIAYGIYFAIMLWYNMLISKKISQQYQRERDL